MATQGPLSPATTVDDSSTGTVAWTNPNNSQVSDNVYTTFTASGGSQQQSHYLKATNFGFAIPTGATINGILAEIEMNISSGTDWLATVRSVKGGVIGGVDRSDINKIYTTSDSYISYGSSSDLWGQTWTPTDINANDFGIALNNYLTNLTTSIDHIRITVYYTEVISTLTGTSTLTGVQSLTI